MPANKVNPGAPAPDDPTVASTKRGPKPPVWEDISETLSTIKNMDPKERQASRTARGELLMDIWLVRAAERLQSDKVRSQDLIAVAGFLKAQGFQVEPSKAGKEDYLDKLAREKREAAADESRRLKNMERERLKREAKATAFYQKIDNPTEPTKRLNAGEPGTINPADDSEETTCE